VLDDASSLRGRISHADQLKLDEYLTSVRDVEARIERAGKEQQLQGWRPNALKTEHPAPGRRRASGHRRAHEADVRHSRAGFPDRHTRFCTLKLNNDHSSLRFPNLGVDYMIHHLLSHTDSARLAQGQPVLRQPARLPRCQAGRDPGRRTLGPRTFHHHVLFEHADRRPRRISASGRDPGPRRRETRQRPHTRLSGEAEPQDVQPVPLLDGQVWCKIARVRRLAGAAHGGLKPAEQIERFVACLVPSNLAGKTESIFREETFCARPAAGLGALALAWLFESERSRGESTSDSQARPSPHFPPRATRVIYLFMHGGAQPPGNV